MRKACAVGSIGADDELLSLLDRFDGAWRGQTPPRIDEFLPPAPGGAGAGAAALRRDRLEELIKIDLEYRWRLAPHDRAGRSAPGSPGGGPGGDPLPARPLLEDYLALYHELGPPERLSPALIGEEYRVRRRWGDRPRREEYAARFAAQGAALEAILAAVDAELATGSTPVDRPLSDDLGTITHHQGPPLCCRHCSAPIDPPPGVPPEDLACPACGAVQVATVPTAECGPTEAPPFPRVGRYELGELLGMGSFGSVWRGRDPELGRAVAIKLPRGGVIDGRAQEERFLREARALARLRHPGIVAVHDTGRDHGTVYIVSELVHGPSLAQWLEQRRLGIRQAAELAAQVADALEYAHRHGVVHRDLKPSNILLEWDGTDGDDPPGEAGPGPGLAGISGLAADSPAPRDRPALRPRIVDFGLAKRDVDEATMTLEGQVLGTLSYMSPEQLRSPHKVDGRGDIYSLGVVLYQMLTSERPFRGVSRMIQVQVLEDEPAPPRRLNDRVPRDLETIALKCLEKEPARRYATAGELADDLRRFLAGEPIRARPAGRLERLGRRCRRNPIIAGLVAGLVVAVLAGFAGVTWQWRRAQAAAGTARQERDRAEDNLVLAWKVVEEMYTQVASELARQRRLPEYQRRLLEKAQGFYETAALLQSGSPGLRQAAGQASARLAIIRQKLAEMDRAEAAYRRALELLGPLAVEFPSEPDYTHSLAVVYGQTADFYLATNRSQPAVAAQEAAVALFERLAAADPGVVRYRADLADSYNNLALCYLTDGRPEQAVAVHRKNVGLYESLAAEHPRDTDIQFALARGLVNLGEACKAAGRAPEATAALRRAAELHEMLTGGQPRAPRDGRRQAIILCQLGFIQAELGDSAAAAAAFRRAIEHYEAVASARPGDTSDRFELAVLHHNLGAVNHRAGRRREAEPSYHQALELLEPLVAKVAGQAEYRAELARCETDLGALLPEVGRAGEAEPMLVRAAEDLERLIREDPQVVGYRQTLPETLAVLGRLYRESGRTDEAVRAYRRALEVLEVLRYPTAEGLYHLAAVRAQCAVLTDRPGTASPDGGRPAALEASVDAMRRAVAAGFVDRDRLRRDTNLDPLRSRADFRAIELVLMDAAFPADPFAR
jgi:serine/threonine-protein kinase